MSTTRRTPVITGNRSQSRQHLQEQKKNPVTSSQTAENGRIPTGLMYVMEYFHLVSGLEWYQVIAVMTVVMRTLTLPFTVMCNGETRRGRVGATSEAGATSRTRGETQAQTILRRRRDT